MVCHSPLYAAVVKDSCAMEKKEPPPPLTTSPPPLLPPQCSITHTLSLSLSLKHTHTRIHTREHTRKKKMELEQEHFSIACTLKNEGFRVTMAYIGYKCFHIWASILGRPSQTLTLNIVKVLENKWCASHRRSHKYQYVHMRPTSPAMTQNNARI